MGFDIGNVTARYAAALVVSVALALPTAAQDATGKPASADAPKRTVERQGGEIWLNGEPVRGFFWTFRELDWQAKRDNGKHADINVLNLLRPRSAGGYGYNLVLTDPERLRPGDLERLDVVGGHAMIQLSGWQGMVDFRVGRWKEPRFDGDRAVRSDGKVLSGLSFDSERNRAHVAAQLRRFKAEYGNPRSLLGFYLFESTPNMPWGNEGRYTDYSEPSKAKFRQWLSRRYGSIGKFNARHGTKYASFAAVEPPATEKQVRERGMHGSFWHDWIDFRYWAQAEYASWLRATVKEIFGKDKLLYATEGITQSYCANDDNVAGSNSFYAIDERQRARAMDAIGVEGTYDYMPNHTRILRRAADFDGDGYPDIPLWMDFYLYAWQPFPRGENFAEPGRIPPLRQIEELGAGASGTLMEHAGASVVIWDEKGDDKIDPQRMEVWPRLAEVNDLHARYAHLFSRSLPAEDVHVVLPTWQFCYDGDYRGTARRWDHLASAHQHALQRGQRQIGALYADSPLPSAARALFVPLGGRTSPAFVARLRCAAEGGARLFLEGNPLLDEFGDRKDIGVAALAGVTAKPLEGRQEIVWNDETRLPAENVYRLTTTDAEVVARFADGSPAMVRRKVGRGEVIWCPSMVGSLAAAEAWQGALYSLKFPEPVRRFYGDIARLLSDPLARVAGAASPGDLRAFLLRKEGVTLAILTNWSASEQAFTLAVAGRDAAAVDLRTGKPVPVKLLGGTASLPVRLDGHDWTVIALGANAETLAKRLANPAVGQMATK